SDLKFPSGLRAIVDEDHRAPVVAVAVVVGGGTSADPQGKEGLAHLVEHLSFRSRPDGRIEMANLLAATGVSESNAETSFDSITYFDLAPSTAARDLLRLEGIRFSDPLAGVTPETLEVERAIVQNEHLERGQARKPTAGLSAMNAALFPPGHPYSRGLAG